MIRIFGAPSARDSTEYSSKWCITGNHTTKVLYDEVIKWKHFPRYRPFVRENQQSLVNFPHKGQWGGTLTMFLDLRLNKRLSKHWWGWWFETPLCPLWRHCNENGCNGIISMQVIYTLQSRQMRFMASQILNLSTTQSIFAHQLVTRIHKELIT